MTFDRTLTPAARDLHPIGPRPRLRGVIDCKTGGFVGVRGLLLSTLMRECRVDYRLVQQYVDFLRSAVALRGGLLKFAIVDSPTCFVDDNTIITLRRLMRVNGIGLVLEHAAGAHGDSLCRLKAFTVKAEALGVPVALRVPIDLRSHEQYGCLLATLALVQPRVVVTEARDSLAQVLTNRQMEPPLVAQRRRLILWSCANEPSDRTELARRGVDFTDIPLVQHDPRLPLGAVLRTDPAIVSQGSPRA